MNGQLIFRNLSSKRLIKLFIPYGESQNAHTIGFATILNRLRRTRFATRRVPRSGFSIVV